MEDLCGGGSIIRYPVQSGGNLISTTIQHLQDGCHIPRGQVGPTSSHVVSGRTLKHGPRGYAELRRVKHQRWVQQPSSKWVWHNSCKGRRGVWRDGIPGEQQGPRISDGSGCLGDTSCGGADGTTSKSRTCTCLPPTILNACRLRDCLGQPMTALDGEKHTSATYGHPALPSSLRLPRENECNGVKRPRLGPGAGSGGPSGSP